MNTLFSNIVFESNGCVNFIQSQMQAPVTFLQKRVMVVAMAILHAYNSLCSFTHHHFVASQGEKTKKNLPSVRKKANQRQKRSRSYSQQVDAKSDSHSLYRSIGDVQRSNEISISPNKNHAKSIQERLEKNRIYAQEQQVKEVAKGFKVEEEDPPQAIQILDPNLGILVRTIDGEEQEINGRSVGMASCQGARSTMEDTSIAEHCSFQIQGEDYTFDLYGICDGHGGGECSAYVQANLANYLIAALKNENPEKLTEEGIFKALKACCRNLDKDYEGSDGTTLAATFILNGKIWNFSVGDSRIILVTKDGRVIQASEDAKPEIDRYRKKIEKQGGSVIEVDGVARINGVLSPARAIGDKQVRGVGGQCCVSPNPKITSFSLKDFEDGYLAIACDGLWDVATTNEAGAAIVQMDALNISTGKMSQLLTYHALDQGTQDNVSITVVKL